MKKALIKVKQLNFLFPLVFVYIQQFFNYKLIITKKSLINSTLYPNINIYNKQKNLTTINIQQKNNPPLQQKINYSVKYQFLSVTIDLMHELRNITNFQRHLQQSLKDDTHLQKKIVHQLDNQGCKCTLCQKVIINEMKIVKKVDYKDNESEYAKGRKQQYLMDFLTDYFYIDKQNRKIKVLLPELCLFEKGNPTCLMTKKKDILPLKMLKNKQKMNAFQIQNFFIQGYIYHNNLKENQQIMKNHKVTTLKKQYYKFDQYLKNQCIVLVKFINGSCQMMTPVELNNLFKCKQKHVRQEILYIQTMPCSSTYNEIRCHIDLTSREYSCQINGLYERAKNQVKMINQNIKPKDFMFIPEREERKFQQELKKKDQKQYLKYLTLKFLLVYSLRTDTLLEKCLFKYVKDQKQGYYYLVDIQVYQKGSASKLWGQFEKKKAQSPQKNNIKRRPASSPEKLQNRKVHTQQNNLENIDSELKRFVIEAEPTDNFTFHSKKHIQNKKQLKKIQERIKSNSLFKLQPIKKNSQRTRRLVSSIVSKNTDASRMLLKRFL